MNSIGTACGRLYDCFHTHGGCDKSYSDNHDRYAAWYTSMYLIQDTGESLAAHRQRDFASDPLAAYLEFWGVMQAVVIQQDAIVELYWSLLKKRFSVHKLESWSSLRSLRNECAGHPAKTTSPPEAPTRRTFMGRGFGGYDSIKYEQWSPPDLVIHPTAQLGTLLTLTLPMPPPRSRRPGTEHVGRRMPSNKALPADVGTAGSNL